MTYASPNTINASVGLVEVFNYINDVTEGWVSIMLMLAIYVIVLVGFYKAQNDFKGAMAVAGYGVFVVALLFWIGGIITAWSLGIAISLALVGTIVLLLDNN